MIIFGTRGYAMVVATLMLACQRCGHQPMSLVKQGTKFTLFFIPLFPVSSHWSLVCNFCRQEYPITAQQAQQYQSQMAS